MPNVRFNVCNDKDIPLLSYSFYSSGFELGRSTPHALVPGGYGESTRFNGDIIVKPKTCAAINWTGKFGFFDEYHTSLVTGTWDESKK